MKVALRCVKRFGVVNQHTILVNGKQWNSKHDNNKNNEIRRKNGRLNARAMNQQEPTEKNSIQIHWIIEEEEEEEERFLPVNKMYRSFFHIHTLFI